MRFKLIVFDMDGVIFQKSNFWFELHKALGTYDEGRELTKKYLKSDYQKLVEEVVGRLWRGKNADKYFALLDSSEYNPHAKEAIAQLHSRGYKICIITSGPSHLLERAKNELHIDYGVSNELIIRNNIITGEFKWPIGNDNKLPLLKDFCRKHAINLKETIAVGNDDNDIPKFRSVGYSIAFNSKCEELQQIADVVVDSDDLAKLLPVIP